MKSKSQKQEIFIHVKAESRLMSVNAIVPESKCIRILEDIRDNFSKANARWGNNDLLSVKTCVHNPTLL